MKKFTFIYLLLLFSSPGFAQCWKMVSVGQRHCIAIKNDGTLWGWGFNGTGGQVGNNSMSDVLSPIQISSSTDWEEVSAAPGHTVALKNDGSLWAWGGNLYGQLGDGTTNLKTVPTQIGSSSWKTVRAGGYHSLGIKSDGTLWAWGDNEFATLGDGTFTNRLVPTLISSSTDWKAVSCTLSRSVALKNDGTLWIWGLNSPALGLGFSYAGITYITTPTQIGTDTDWKMAVMGYGHVLALKANNTLWAWGGGDHGQCGNGITSNNFMPTQVGTDMDWATVEADVKASFAIKTNGTLWGWGENTNGQLGNNSFDNLLVPTQITTAANWKSVSTSSVSTTAITTDGSLFSWGYNFYGELGDGTTTDQPAPLLINACNLGIGDFADNDAFLLYPNPTHGAVTLQFDSPVNDAQLELYDLTGRLVAQYEANGPQGSWQLDFSPIATGVYVVVVQQGNQVIMQKKLQKI
jgi:alpha-tubulin suppressor-like RCC1 family protein